MRFSRLANVSFPAPVATPVVRFALTTATFSYDTVSVPGPPSMVSLPVPAQIMSLPARPLITSVPPPLSITSLPAVPVNVWLAEVPWIVTVSPPQTVAATAGAAADTITPPAPRALTASTQTVRRPVRRPTPMIAPALCETQPLGTMPDFAGRRQVSGIDRALNHWVDGSRATAPGIATRVDRHGRDRR